MKLNPNIIVRKADKSNIYVILNKEDYKSKLDAILSDQSKFKKITRNPTNDLKNSLNKLIKQNNQEQGKKVFQTVTDDYKPGYLYGNVKTHKKNNPLRPIISQIPAPTYATAKKLNEIISKYLPAKYQINSTDQFLEIVRATNPNNNLASLDVESLFTNVPVDQTIEIICNSVYDNLNIPPPPVQRPILKKLLEICTKECPFTHIDGSMYVQVDGVSMGSPLGVTFANFFMTYLENSIFDKYPDSKPAVYCRYVDDCFISVDKIDKIPLIAKLFEMQCSLIFTFEIGYGSRLNFLDVHVNASPPIIHTSVYTKPTNPGIYLHANSECTQQYKNSTIKALIHRTYKISSDWSHFCSSIQTLKQSIVNNGYSNRFFDKILSHYLDTILTPKQQKTNVETYTIYYKNQYSTAYKTDERILKHIIKTNTHCNNPEDKLKFTVYYKNRYISSLFMRNNSAKPTPTFQQTNLVYEYKCLLGDCEHQNSSYIGLTTNTLSRRLTLHLSN